MTNGTNNLAIPTGWDYLGIKKMKTSTSPHYYHCATKGFDHCVLFADLREFIAGMNRIALCTAKLKESLPVIVIAFCLMDNHLHVILYALSQAYHDVAA